MTHEEVDWQYISGLQPGQREAELERVTGIRCEPDRWGNATGTGAREYSAGGTEELDQQAAIVGLQYIENGPGWVPQRSIREALREALRIVALPSVSVALALSVFLRDRNAVTAGGRVIVRYIAQVLLGTHPSGHDRMAVSLMLDQGIEAVAAALLLVLHSEDRAATIRMLPELFGGRVVRGRPLLLDGGARFEFTGLAIIDRQRQRELRLADRARGDERRWPGTLKATVPPVGEVIVLPAPVRIHECTTCKDPCLRGAHRARKVESSALVVADVIPQQRSAMESLRGRVAHSA